MRGGEFACSNRRAPPQAPTPRWAGRWTTSRRRSPSWARAEWIFEEYDIPGLRTVDGIADIEGNYPSKGIGERGAWFRDSEGNLWAATLEVLERDSRSRRRNTPPPRPLHSSTRGRSRSRARGRPPPRPLPRTNEPGTRARAERGGRRLAPGCDARGTRARSSHASGAAPPGRPIRLCRQPSPAAERPQQLEQPKVRPRQRLVVHLRLHHCHGPAFQRGAQRDSSSRNAGLRLARPLK